MAHRQGEGVGGWVGHGGSGVWAQGWGYGEPPESFSWSMVRKGEVLGGSRHESFCAGAPAQKSPKNSR